MTERMVHPNEQTERDTRRLVEELLNERQKMLAMFCKVSGLEPFHHEKSIREELRDFCQILIDYTALLHLEIEERIVEGKEARPQVIATIEALHEQLVELTTLIVDFNDKYDEFSHQLIMDDLKQDLSRLGEVLAVRAELEDQIVAVMQEEV
ncbi:MAG: Rsd/AlgQ family anti-sigma factor [Gammaproteobacteria bacterium]|nr:Rsd/AlgQ family anti-sigma factor [Gammaproteobacteria bacterium]